MAQSNALLEAGSNLISSVTKGGVWIILVLAAVGLVGGVMYYLFIYRRSFNILCKVISERASDPRTFFDYASIRHDKKNNVKYFKLLGLKVELPVPPFKILESTNKGDYLEIWRKSEDEFVFLAKPRIDKEKMIRADGKVYPVSFMTQRQIEGDMYWMTRRMEDNKKLLSQDSIWMKLLGWAPQIIGGIIVMLMLWIVLSKMPPLVDALTKLAQELNSLKGATVVTG